MTDVIGAVVKITRVAAGDYRKRGGLTDVLLDHLG